MSLQPVIMKDVEIIFKNFEGKEGKFNKKGDRNFAVKLSEDVAAAMAEDGWNVKWLKAREEDEGDEDGDQAILPVAMKYDKGRPPRVVMITSRGPTALSEDGVEMLDGATFEKADMVVRPYTWEVNGKSGVKAYLQSLFVTIEEDPLEKEYAAMFQEQEQEQEMPE